MTSTTTPHSSLAVGLYGEVFTSNHVMLERKRMNKTIKIIAIVLLVLGALAVVGGVCSAIIGRQFMTRGMPALNQPINPHIRGGDRPMKDGRNLPDGFRGGRGFGFLRLPFWLIGGGLTLLVAGIVLLIFNQRIAAAAEPAAITKEKSPAIPAAVAKEKASSANKSPRKKST